MSSQSKKYFAIALLATGLASCGDKGQQQMAPPPPAQVTLEEVKMADAAYHDEYPGTVVPLNQIELRPQVTGFVSGVHFQDGAHVRKGQLLYTIDAQLYSANYDQAVASLAVQEANLVKAQKDADRFHALDKEDAVAKQLVDNADAAFHAAQKQVEAAKANIKAVQTNVRYTNITAPFDGIIGISAVKVGSPVSAGQTVMNTVSTDSQLAVDFNVDQKEIYRFSNLLKKGKAADSTFTLKFGSDVYPYTGKISLIDRAVDPQTGTIRTRLIFPNRDNLLRAGMNGTVRVLNNSGVKSILIPNKALSEQLGEYFVYVLGDSSKVSQRRVDVGTIVGSQIVIKDGLKEGEKIAVEGVQNLREGAVVSTEAPQAKAAPAAH